MKMVVVSFVQKTKHLIKDSTLYKNLEAPMWSLFLWIV
jgi:hypothetical protein